jgi:hypothetical protein
MHGMVVQFWQIKHSIKGHLVMLKWLFVIIIINSIKDYIVVLTKNSIWKAPHLNISMSFAGAKKKLKTKKIATYKKKPQFWSFKSS